MHWIEKYRPKNLDELASHKEIVATIEKFISEKHLPHLLFYGPPGTGKTSTILACARKLYDQNEMNSMVLELNASDDRGIAIVRGPILTFASTRIMFNKNTFKLIILDEADAMTHDAQNALRRIIEKYTNNVRFCFICNYLNKIIPAIQSRCTKFRFAPLKHEQMKTRIDYILAQESVNIDDDVLKTVIQLSDGDMRKALNILQNSSAAFGELNEAKVFQFCGLPNREQIQTIIHWLNTEKFTYCYKKITELQNEYGYSLMDILRGLHRNVQKINFPNEITIQLMDKMADIEVNICAGSTSKIQLAALIAAFQCVRDLNGSFFLNK